MLLPDKHITLAESLLGLGAFLLDELRKPMTIDQLHRRVYQKRETSDLPAFHDIDNLLLAVLFLYSIGAVELADGGRLRRCA